MRWVCSKMQVFDGSTKPASMRRQAEYSPPGPAPATTRSSHGNTLSWAFVDVDASVSTNCAHRNALIARDMGE